MAEQATNPPAAGDAAMDSIARGLSGKQPEQREVPTNVSEPKPAAGTPTAADLDRMVNERVEKALEEHAEKAGTQPADDFTREQFIRANMMDLPPAYQSNAEDRQTGRFAGSGARAAGRISGVVGEPGEGRQESAGAAGGTVQMRGRLLAH